MGTQLWPSFQESAHTFNLINIQIVIATLQFTTIHYIQANIMRIKIYTTLLLLSFMSHYAHAEETEEQWDCVPDSTGAFYVEGTEGNGMRYCDWAARKHTERRCDIRVVQWQVSEAEKGKKKTLNYKATATAVTPLLVGTYHSLIIMLTYLPNQNKTVSHHLSDAMCLS